MPMTHNPQSDPTLANRYLAGQLSAQEQADFEVALGENPELLRELEATARLKLGLARLQMRGELDGMLPLAGGRGGARSIRRLRAPVLALAASVVAVTAGLILWRASAPSLSPLVETLTSLEQYSRHRYQGSVSFVVLRTRSGDVDVKLPLPPADRAVLLRVLVGGDAGASGLAAELARIRDDQSLHVLARGTGFKAGSDGFVGIYCDPGQLTPGSYLLTLRPAASGNGQAGSQVFRIRVEAAASAP